MAVELAPYHKVGLTISSPLILASGTIGYGDAIARSLDLSCCGAWVTAPIGLKPRLGSPPPRVAEVPGGLVLSETGQNPGVNYVIREFASLWARLELPVIARLWGSDEEQAAVAHQLETVESVAAVELAPDDRQGPADAASLVRAVRHACDLPVLVVLPLLPDVVDWAMACREAGADVLVIGQPPRALGMTVDGTSVLGRLYGPAVIPLAWAALEQVNRANVGLSLIGTGGVHRPADVQTFLRLGAVAVAVDVAIWVDPTLLRRLFDYLKS